jgi:hypothetical protein
VVNVQAEKTKKELAEEVELLDTMLSSLVELLEEKGLVTQKEWEQRIKERIHLWTWKLIYLFKLGEYPKNGRLAKYEKQLIALLNVNDNDGIVVFSNTIFQDCVNYLVASHNLKIPELYLNLMNHKDYTNLCNNLDLLLGKIPRTLAIYVGNTLGFSPEVCVDFETTFSFFTSTKMPINFLINLIVSYIEELVHAANPYKSETEIHQTTCEAIEGFTEVKLSEDIKKKRLEYAKLVDSKKKPKSWQITQQYHGLNIQSFPIWVSNLIGSLTMISIIVGWFLYGK